jgi:hypothetical protein
VRFVALLGLPPLLIFAVLYAIMFLPLPSPFPRAGSDVRERVALVLAPIFFIAYLAAVMTNMLAVFDQPGRVLDREMARRGLASRRSGIFGRSYQGDLQGYPVSIDFQPAAGSRLHLLNLRVSVAAGHRSAAGQRSASGGTRPLLDCRDCPEIPFSEPEMAGLRVFADDETWIRSVLASSSAQTVLAGLIRGSAWSGVNEVYIQPQRLWLRSHTRLPDADAGDWIPMLLTLARAVAAGSGAEGS